ncbi:oxygen-insensitive NADPH nitroreductase [Virgibacillus litoralis]|uniref:FMN reductase (NADPH) n=1 Tax=Virgibacillus litoralis TaxID=578221 RepID=A0ABS4HDK0_9BACI|nr:oxygen-insensitive NADPH nitroreductase [Virgibacillus litoralis]MBP1948704.1 FMN reductase (NADPH) [Virgibacillus litoralis]
MNNTINIISNHRSIRKFKSEKLTTEQIHKIIGAAQQASTSSYVMAYTVIGITDETVKEKLKEVSGQDYVKENGHFFVFCADLNRIYQQATAEEQKEMQKSLESTEQFLVSTVDTALVAQNTAVAAESMGLGTCFIGSLRNNINRVNDILELPDYVVPLFGMAVGYPDENPDKKPRLPIDAIYHENKYNTDYQFQQELIDNFNAELKTYYQTRSNNTRTDTWSEQMVRKYKNAIRMDVTPFIRSKNLNKR